jgi:hypothetical protein
MNVDERIRYIGVVSLLARLSDRIEDEDDKDCIERALEDACADGRMRYGRTITGGFYLELASDPEEN